jgi:hypothetical protein
VIDGAATMKKVLEVVSQAFRSVRVSTSMLNTKIHETTSIIIGTVPTNISPRLLVHTFWRTIAEVASILDSTTKRANNSTSSLTMEQVSHVQTLLVAFLESQINPLVALARVAW